MTGRVLVPGFLLSSFSLLLSLQLPFCAIFYFILFYFILFYFILLAKVFIYFLILIFYCYSITVVCLFSPSHHPTPAKLCHNLKAHFCFSKMGIIIVPIYQQTASVGDNVKKREPFCTVGGNAGWCSHCGKQYGLPSKN